MSVDLNALSAEELAELAVFPRASCPECGTFHYAELGIGSMRCRFCDARWPYELPRPKPDFRQTWFGWPAL